MLDKFFSTKLELNQNVLRKNIKFLKNKIGNKTEIIAVLKANAYGFGDILLAKKIIKEGIKNIAVADFEEGLRLRNHGVSASIMIMYPGLNNLKPIIQNNLKPVLVDAEKGSWEKWLLKQKGFLGRKLFWDPQREEATLLISWTSRDQWKSIPQSEINIVQKDFEKIALQGTRNESGNPFPILFEGELLPQ